MHRKLLAFLVYPLSHQLNASLILTVLSTLLISPSTASAEKLKLGDWKLMLRKSSCFMEYRGWGKNLNVYHLPGVVTYISFYGLRMDDYYLAGSEGGELIADSDTSAHSVTFGYHPYAGNHEFAHTRYGLTASGFLGFDADSHGYTEPSLGDVFRFLDFMEKSNGQFTFYTAKKRKYIIEYEISKTKQAVVLMRDCLVNVKF